MRNYLFTCLLLLAGLFSAGLTAQINLTAAKYNSIPVHTLPAQDNAQLLGKEMDARRPGRMPLFAVNLPVAIRPSTHGEWTTEGNTAVWRERILSPGAKTINLGFSEYRLPAGAELRMLTPDETVGPFTVSDNETHNELWTPVIGGDELLLELRVPAHLVKEVQLYLTFVNHDFVDIRSDLEKSGSCNLDVVCGEADGWAIVDGYRDIIRSVAALHRGGSGFCTGFLINNVNEDGTPFFMTANHCGVNAGNAASLVTYWNFESANCRQPNSPASGGNGGGLLNTFNSGATHLASYAPSDMTLVLLDDPVAANANAFFAGWSAEEDVPTDTLIAVHHPSVDEKRISFAFADAIRAPYLGTTTVDGADHITVDDWDIGTTEGGSSGSPIFDRFRRVRGQLHGGFAACGNDDLDSYGYWATSWEGGGTPETSLRGWLDPCGTGTITIDGFDQSDIDNVLTSANTCGGGCTTTDNVLTFTLGDNFPAGTNLAVSDVATGIDAVLSSATAGGGEDVTLTVSGDDVPNGVYSVTVNATGGGISDDITFTLELSSAQAGAPANPDPADGSASVFPAATFDWSDVATAFAYELQLSVDSDFSTLLESVTGLEDSEASLGTALTSNTTYYWRVRAVNDCGPGDWTTSSFITADISCAPVTSTDTPVAIDAGPANVVSATLMVAQELSVGSMEVTVEIDHTYVGDLSAVLVSPDGASIRLFGEIANGACSGNDMVVVFSDAATATHEDFLTTCDNGPAVEGTFQPLDELATFQGESAQGEWELIVTDDAGFDGGALTAFSILFCTEGDIVDFGVSANVDAFEACINNDPTSVNLSVGPSFVGDLGLVVSADGQMLDNFTFDYNASDRVLTVDFSAWTLIGTGNHTLEFTVLDDDNNSQSTTVDLTVEGDPGAAGLTSPADNADVPQGDVTLTWTGGADADSYVVEYSTNADFSVITGTQNANGTAAILANLPDDAPTIYWRVVSRGDCGTAVSDVRQFNITPGALHDFGGGRALNVFPNPVRRLLTVEATGNWTAGVDGILFDAAGRNLKQYRMDGAGRTQWDLGLLPAGVYYLRLTSAGTQRTERLVVTK